MAIRESRKARAARERMDELIVERDRLKRQAREENQLNARCGTMLIDALGMRDEVEMCQRYPEHLKMRFIGFGAPSQGAPSRKLEMYVTSVDGVEIKSIRASLIRIENSAHFDFFVTNPRQGLIAALRLLASVQSPLDVMRVAASLPIPELVKEVVR